MAPKEKPSPPPKQRSREANIKLIKKQWGIARIADAMDSTTWPHGSTRTPPEDQEWDEAIVTALANLAEITKGRGKGQDVKAALLVKYREMGRGEAELSRVDKMELLKKDVEMVYGDMVNKGRSSASGEGKCANVDEVAGANNATGQRRLGSAAGSMKSMRRASEEDDLDGEGNDGSMEKSRSLKHPTETNHQEQQEEEEDPNKEAATNSVRSSDPILVKVRENWGISHIGDAVPDVMRPGDLGTNWKKYGDIITGFFHLSEITPGRLEEVKSKLQETFERRGSKGRIWQKDVNNVHEYFKNEAKHSGESHHEDDRVDEVELSSFSNTRDAHLPTSRPPVQRATSQVKTFSSADSHISHYNGTIEDPNRGNEELRNDASNTARRSTADDAAPEANAAMNSNEMHTTEGSLHGDPALDHYPILTQNQEGVNRDEHTTTGQAPVSRGRQDSRLNELRNERKRKRSEVIKARDAYMTAEARERRASIQGSNRRYAVAEQKRCEAREVYERRRQSIVRIAARIAEMKRDMNEGNQRM